MADNVREFIATGLSGGLQAVTDLAKYPSLATNAITFTLPKKERTKRAVMIRNFFDNPLSDDLNAYRNHLRNKNKVLHTAGEIGVTGAAAFPLKAAQAWSLAGIPERLAGALLNNPNKYNYIGRAFGNTMAKASGHELGTESLLDYTLINE